MKSTYKDDELALFAKCNLLDIGEPEEQYQAAYRTTKWSLMRVADQKPITKTLLTSKYEQEYVALFPNIQVKDQEYWKGFRAGRHFVSKLFWLLSKYDVLQPIQTYSHVVNDLKIEGEYAVIQKRSETEKPLVLILKDNKSSYSPYPEASSSCKWLHATNNYMSVGIYYFCMFRGEDWKQKNFDKPLINKWITAILKQISSNNNYVTPGSHCTLCFSKRCLEAYNVR